MFTDFFGRHRAEKFDFVRKSEFFYLFFYLFFKFADTDHIEREVDTVVFDLFCNVNRGFGVFPTEKPTAPQDRVRFFAAYDLVNIVVALDLRKIAPFVRLVRVRADKTAVGRGVGARAEHIKIRFAIFRVTAVNAEEHSRIEYSDAPLLEKSFAVTQGKPVLFKPFFNKGVRRRADNDDVALFSEFHRFFIFFFVFVGVHAVGGAAEITVPHIEPLFRHRLGRNELKPVAEPPHHRLAKRRLVVEQKIREKCNCHISFHKRSQFPLCSL